MARQLCSSADDSGEFLRVAKPFQSSLFKGVDADDTAAAASCLLQRRQHAGVIGPWVLTDDNDAVGKIKILEGYCSFAGSDGARQSQATGLVTHVGTIRQVIRSEKSHKELVKKGCLVACSS